MHLNTCYGCVLPAHSECGEKHLVLSVNLSVNPLNPIVHFWVHHTMHHAMVLRGLIPRLHEQV